jgi:hypothetical protein
MSEHGDQRGTRLSDGKVGTAEVERTSEGVRRSAGPGAPAVHRLLHALAAVDLPVPVPVRLDHATGVEVLTFVEGRTPTLPWPAWIADEELLTDAARLLRRLHDATVPLVDRLDGPWWRWDGAENSAEVIRHGDPWPPNLVVRDGRAVAWIDWDLAQPGRRIDDVAAFAKHWAPMMSDERALGHGWPEVPDRVRRLRLLADAYGLDATGRAHLVDAIIEFGHVTARSHRAWAADGRRPFAVMVARGISEAIERDAMWTLERRAEFDAALA